MTPDPFFFPNKSYEAKKIHYNLEVKHRFLSTYRCFRLLSLSLVLITAACSSVVVKVDPDASESEASAILAIERSKIGIQVLTIDGKEMTDLEKSASASSSNKFMGQIVYALTPGSHTIHVYTSDKGLFAAAIESGKKQVLQFPVEAGKHYTLVATKDAGEAFIGIIDREKNRLISGKWRKGWMLVNAHCFNRACDRTTCTELYDCDVCYSKPINPQEPTILRNNCEVVKGD